MKKMTPDSPDVAPQPRPDLGSNGGEATPARETPSDPWAAATRWVQEHQAASLAGAFGLGVFIGVLLRSK